MKKSILLSAFLAVFSFEAFICDAQETVFPYTHQGTTLYYIIDNNQQAVVVPPTYPNYYTSADGWTWPWYGYDEPQGAVAIPDTVVFSGINYPVVALGGRAFQRCSGITTIALPSTVQVIGLGSMAQCHNLQSITIPEGLVTIEEWAFTEDTSLLAVSLPESVTSVGAYAFDYCTHLISVTLPQQLTLIPDGCFNYCHELESVNMPSSLTEIGGWAFDSVLTLSEVVLPEGFTTLGIAAFQDCIGLQRVVLPSTLDSVEGWAFYNCQQLDSLIFPDALLHIGPVCMELCGSLTYCHLPERLEFMDEWLMYSTRLSSIEVPPHVTHINIGALSGCTELHKVTLPALLTALGDSVFNYGTPLDTLILLCSVPPTANESVFTDYTATLIVPCGTESAYRQHAVWGQFQKIIENCNGIDDIEADDIKVYAREGHIVVEGAEGEIVQVFDIMGRPINPEQAIDTGIYMVKVGNRPSQKVVVLK